MEIAPVLKSFNLGISTTGSGKKLSAFNAITPALVLFLVVLFLAPYNSLAQNKQLIDSLKQELPKVSAEKRFDLLNTIGFEYRLSYPDSTIYYCKQAYQLGKELGLKSGLSRPLSFIGLAMAYKGDNAQSFDYHGRAIETARQEGDSLQLAYGYNNLGRLFFDQGDLTRAYKYFIDALRLMEYTQDKLGLSYVHRSLSTLYKSQRDLNKALEASKLALDFRLKLGEERPILSAYSELGLVYQQRGETEWAISCFSKADSIARSINDKISLAELKLGLAEIHVDRQAISGALSLANEAFDIIRETQNQRLLPRANLIMARLKIEERQFSVAELYLNSLLLDAEQTNNLAMLRDGYFLLAKVAEAKRDEEKALQLQNKYLVLKEQLNNVELAREIDRLEFRLTIERKEKENELLKANEERIEAQLELQRLERIGLTIVIFFISLLALVLWRSNKRKNDDNSNLAAQRDFIEKQRKEIEEQNQRISEQNRVLSKRNEELADLNNEKDTLMNIVAHDLKSPLNRIQGLVSLIELSGNLTDEQIGYLNMLKNVTKSGNELISDLLDVNAIESDRQKIEFKKINVSHFLNDRISNFISAAKAKDIKLTITAPDILYIDSDENLLGRIIDNLISNAIKFSPRGMAIEVSAAEKEGKMFFTVKDEGPGFSVADQEMLYQKFRKLSARPTAGESSNGLGLAIVKILTERLKGEVKLVSEQGKGSEFIIALPVEAVLTSKI